MHTNHLLFLLDCGHWNCGIVIVYPHEPEMVSSIVTFCTVPWLYRDECLPIPQFGSCFMSLTPSIQGLIVKLALGILVWNYRRSWLLWGVGTNLPWDCIEYLLAHVKGVQASMSLSVDAFSGSHKWTRPVFYSIPSITKLGLVSVTNNWLLIYYLFATISMYCTVL